MGEFQKLTDFDKTEVINLTNLANYSSGGSYSDLEMDAMSLANNEANLDKGLLNHDFDCYAYLIEGDIVGYFFYRKSDSWLWRIMVHPDFQGKGIGGKLMKKVKLLMNENNSTQIYSYVRLSSSEFFKKNGFFDNGKFIWKRGGLDIELREMRFKI